jgi:hypothetical protein
VDLCESDEEGRQEQQQLSLPQHLDWDYIAERRAAYSAVQSLSALTQPCAASVKPRSAIVTQLTKGKAAKRKQNAKGNRKWAASHALKSPERKKKRKKGENTSNATTRDRKSKGKDNNMKRKKYEWKSPNENPSRQNRKKKIKAEGVAKKEGPTSGPRSTKETLTAASNTGRSHDRTSEGVSSRTERNRHKRRRAKENKRARAQNHAAFEEFNGKPPLSRDGHKSNPTDYKVNAGEENLSHHFSLISDRGNEGHNLEPWSLGQLDSSSQKHGVPLCHNVSDPDKSLWEHDPVPIDGEIKFENQHEVYVDGNFQNCKPPERFVVKHESETSPALTASTSSGFAALNDNEKPAKVYETSWRRVPPKDTTDRQTLKRAAGEASQYSAHCPTQDRFKGQGMWTRHFADEHNKNTKIYKPQALPACVEVQQQGQRQSSVQQTSSLDREYKTQSLSNHVEAAVTIKANRDGLVFKEEQHDDAQDKLNENDQTISDTDPDPVAREIEFEEQPEVFIDSSSQSCRPQESFEVNNDIEASSAETAGILSTSAAPNDTLQKEQHQSGAQKTSGLDQKDIAPSLSNHVEAADTAEVDRAGHRCQEEQQDDVKETSKQHDAVVSDTDPDQLGKKNKLENEPDVDGENRRQNCKPPSSFEVKGENEISSAEPASISSVSAAPNDRVEKVHHQSGTQQTPASYQNDKLLSSSNHVEEADSVEAERASLRRSGEQHDPAVSDIDDRESMLLNQWHVQTESSTQEGRAPTWRNVDENEESSIKAMPSVSLDDKLQKDKNQTAMEYDEVLAQLVSRTDIDNETVKSLEIGRSYQETKKLPHLDAHFTFNDRCRYWDSRDDGVVSDESRSRASGSREEKKPAVYTRNETQSKRQGSPHESHDSSPDAYVCDDGSVVFVNKESQAKVKPPEKAKKLPTTQGASTIDLSGVASPDRRDNSRKRSNERMAYSEESLNAKSCPGSGHGSSLRDLIRTNCGKGPSGKVKKSAPPQFEGKSWRSTVIIIDSSDEDVLEHDAPNRKGAGRAPAATGIGSSNKNKSSHQGFWEAAPQQPSVACKSTARKRAKRPPTHNAEYYNRSTQYNFSFSETEAHREQERLFREAAARVRKGLAMNVGHSAPFVADANIPDVSKLNQNHWKSKDPYACLGLPRGASINIIKSRYRRLALKYHPDKSNFEHTTARFQAVTEAYKLLTGMG